MLVEVSVQQLPADVREVHCLYAQPVLLCGFHLEFSQTHEWIARPCCLLLRLVQRYATHTSSCIVSV